MLGRMMLAFLASAILAACATVEQESRASRPANVETFSSIGDVMLRVDVREDLPNAFGRADAFGRTRDRGFSDLRFMGLAADGLAIFRRRDVDIVTNENTMNRTGLGTNTFTATQHGNTITGTGIVTRTPAPNIQALPPDTIEFTLDLRQGRTITLREQTIEILEATPSGVRFVVR
ncbi:MAG: hypothetical protein GC206_15885 [Alphaproteobacteria bacterium]|nr:hypothetical protein [Alphaproteobacteria bacterium]